MKRMVLIPEERLLRYEERDKQRGEQDIMYGGGEGIILEDYLYKYPGQ